MIGLAISQFLWATHYDIYIFFEDSIENNKEHILSYREIGPGHGLFLNKAMDYINNKAKVTVIDISPISIDITKSIMRYFKPNNKNIIYKNIDILEFNSVEEYDFITMGEVLEHVNSPEKLLSKINGLLTENGKLFISTCVNCPAIDHVYHFKTVDEIRNMLNSNGYSIEEELVLPVEDLAMNEIVDKKITINYCAILKKEALDEKNH